MVCGHFVLSWSRNVTWPALRSNTWPSGRRSNIAHNAGDVDSFQTAYLLVMKSQCLATDWTTRRSRFNPPQGQETFSLTSASRPTLGPTQLPVQWVPGVLFPGVKRGRGVTLTTYPHPVPMPRMGRSYTSSASIGVCCGTALLQWRLHPRSENDFLRFLPRTERCLLTV
jgi:hypothetical protein